MKRMVVVLGLSLVAALGSGRAEAVAPSATPKVVALPKLDRAVFLASVAEARARSPRTFEAVARVRAELPALDAKKRGPIAPIASMFSHLGPDAFAALAERVVDDDASLAGTARRAWRVGVIEALGALRDPRSVEVLAPLLDDPDDLVVRVAAEAIGKSGDGKLLVSRFDREPVVAGAGYCRRRGMASALATVVARRESPALVKAAVRALGDVGSSWAWKTGKVPAKSEEAEVRAIAAAALVDAFVGYDGEIRQAASNALMMVDDPSTPARIVTAKAGASLDTIAALDKLAVRFAKNPAR